MDKYQATRQTRLAYEAAEADPALAGLVTAYTRLCTDRGASPFYEDDPIAARSALESVSFHLRPFLARNPHLDPRFALLCVHYGEELTRKRLPVLFGPEDLAFHLGISLRQLNWLAYSRAGRYRTKQIPKTGGTRVLHVPVPKLKTVQRWITERVLLKSRPHRYATAFYPGSSLVRGASPHVGRQLVVRLDLSDFFTSITFTRVRRLFTRMGYTHAVAHLLANLCCQEGRLPQGAPSSPALSNLAARTLDRRIEGLKKYLAAKDRGPERLAFYYTRYADDLVFSSNSEALLRIIPFVRDIVAGEGFAVNEAKTRIMRQGRQQCVTGLVVNERLNPPPALPRLLRAVLHGAKRDGISTAMQKWSAASGRSVRSPGHFRQILRGKIAFVASANPGKAAKLLDMLGAVDFNSA